MSKIINMFVALTLGAALAVPMVAQAAVGKAFLHGVKNPAELASKIEASLVQNPKGTNMLDPARCKSDGSCATPLNYLEALQQVNPGAHLTSVAQVPDFLRTLKVVDAPAGEYWISCLRPDGHGTYKAVLHCLSRSFKKGEKAWIDAKSGVIVFASDCTNVVEKPVPPKDECVYIPFTTKPGDTGVRFPLIGLEAPKDDDPCLAVKRAGESDYERWWIDHCPEAHCDFSANVALLQQYVPGSKVLVFGSFEPKVHGEHILRLPKYVAKKGSKYVTLICIETTNVAWPVIPTAPAKELAATNREQYDVAYAEYLQKVSAYNASRREWIAGHSLAEFVWWIDYHDGVARVYRTPSDIPAGLTGNRPARRFR